MVRMKKGLLIILTLLIAFSLILSGCGKKDEGTQTTTTTRATTTGAGTTTTTQQTTAKETLGLPIVEETVTYNVLRWRHPYNIPMKDMPMWINLEEATNVHIEWEEVEVGVWAERKGLMLASDDLPDAVMHGLTDFDVLTYKHLFLPLEELIYDYAPNIVELFTKRPETKVQSTADDGNIYTFPLLYEVFASATTPGFGINKVWLERVGMSIPTTTEDFYNMLVAFRDNDPNQNGEKDEIPFIFVGLTNTWAGAGPIFGAFGVLPFAQVMQVVDDELVYPYTQPGFKQGIQYFHRLYSEGLIDQEVFTQDATQYLAKVASDPAICGVHVAWEITGLVNQAEKDDYVLMPALRGPDGHQLYHRNTPTTIVRHAFTVSSKIQRPDVMVRWVNELYTEDMSIQQLWGSYGVTIEKRPDGTIGWLPPPEGMDQGGWGWTNAPVSFSVAAIYKEWESRFEATEGVIKKNAQNAILEPYLPEKVFPNIFYSLEETTEINELQPDITSYINQTVTNWIVNGGVENEWDAFVTQLNRMGVPRLIEIWTNAYNRYYGN